MSMFHRDAPAGDIHQIHQWTYGDATARGAATGFVSSDVGKAALQVDTSEYYILTNYSPITWQRIGSSTQADIDAHVNDPTAAHAASAISNTPSGNLASTNVQGALNELQGDIDTNASNISSNASNLTAHTGAVSNAHAASAISNSPSGSLASTDVQSALNELQSDVDTRALDSDLTAHTGASSGVHGVTGAVVGTTDAQTLTNKTLTAPAISSPTGLVKADVGLGNVDNTSDATKNSAAAMLTNKTMGDALTFTEITTPTTPGSGLRKLYPKSDGKLYHLGSDGVETPVGSGSGGGSVNYLDAGDAESISSGAPTTFADGATLTDGAGGTPTATIARTATNPLSGTQSWLYTPGQLGDGFSFDFTLPRGQRTGVQQIDVNYELSGTYADGDIEWWVLPLDGTDTVLKQPAPYKLLNASGPQRNQPMHFQATADASSYRLIGYQKTANTGYTLKFEAAIGPELVAQGSISTSPVNYTPTITGLGTVSGVSIESWREGAFLNVKGRFTAGTPTATEARISLGHGGSDGNVTAATTADGNFRQVGEYTRSAASSNEDHLLLCESGVGYLTFSAVSTAKSGLTKQLGNDVVTAGETIAFHAKVPISGWGSNLVTSADAGDGRVLGLAVHGTPAITLSGSYTVNTLKFSTVDRDDSGTYNASTGEYTASCAGWREVGAKIITDAFAYASGQDYYMMAYVDGVEKLRTPTIMSAGATNALPLQLQNGLVYMNAGQKLTIREMHGASFSINIASSTNPDRGLYVHRLSGPAQVAASESVACSYQNTAGSSIASGGGTAPVPYATKLEDTHGAWNGTTFTAPVSGRYRVTCGVFYASGGWSAGTSKNIMLRKGGTVFSYMSLHVPSTTYTGALGQNAADTIYLKSGETIDIALQHNEGSARTLDTTAGTNFIRIEKVGN